MITRLKAAENSGVQRLRGVAGEYHIPGQGAAEEPCDLLPGGIDGTGGIQSVAMDGTAAVAQGFHGAAHRVDDALGLVHGSCGVVKIDHPGLLLTVVFLRV